MFLSAITLFIPVASGCQSHPAEVFDQRPNHISLEQIESTICIKVGPTIGSAVVLDSNHLLTNVHVFGHETHQNVELFSTCTSSGKFERLESDFELVASGQFRSTAESDGIESDWTRFTADVTSDWALIRTGQSRWDPKSAAIIHPDAMDPKWVVPEGTELFLLGYSNIFMKEVDEQSAPSSEHESFMLHVKNGPYTLRGNALTSRRGLGAVEQSGRGFMPSGHSGGGVYIWNADARRLELVGLFNSGSMGHKTFDIFGLIDVQLGETIFLLYSPIAPALQAWESGSG